MVILPTRLPICWSVSPSREEVASSRIRSLLPLDDNGDYDYEYGKDENENLRTALARQTSCRWPELKLLPPSFSSVARPMSSPCIKLSNIMSSYCHIFIESSNNCIVSWSCDCILILWSVAINTNSLEDAVQLLLLHLLPGVKVEAERARKDHRVLPIKGEILLSWSFSHKLHCIWWSTPIKGWCWTCGTIVIDLLSCCNPNFAVSTPSKKT